MDKRVILTERIKRKEQTYIPYRDRYNFNYIPFQDNYYIPYLHFQENPMQAVGISSRMLGELRHPE